MRKEDQFRQTVRIDLTVLGNSQEAQVHLTVYINLLQKRNASFERILFLTN